MSLPYYIPSNPIPYRILGHLSISMIENFQNGLNFLEIPSHNPTETKSEIIRLLIYQNADQSLIISRNVCRHAGGNFVHDIEDLPEIVRCTYHGWKLNTKTLEYIKPANCLKQKQLAIDKKDNGELIVLEPLLYEPWTLDSQEKQALKEDELTVGYISHSCVEIKANGRRLIVDPCYGRSWWLLHEVQDDLFDRIATADGIFLSKISPDHFHFPTLRRIAKINAHIPIYLSALAINSFENQQIGFVNIHPIQFGIWENFPIKECRLMILPDHKHPYIDTLLLFEYKGYKILNLIDCSSPNGDYLPYSIDALLTNFTSDINVVPSSFSEEKILEMDQIYDENFLKKMIKCIQLSNPAVWIPIGGYFLEAGPDDEQIHRLNWKNNPSTVAQTLNSRFPFLKTWCPFPEGKYDIGTQTADTPLNDYSKKS